MVDGLFFYATFIGRRGGHTPFLQTGAETFDTSAEAVKPDPGSSLGRSFRAGGRQCRGWKCGVLWCCLPTLHFNGVLPSAPHVCCQINWWVVVRWVQRVSRFETPCICTQWTDDRWVEQMSRLRARRARNSVAPLRQRSASWIPARMERLSTGVGRRHPVTIHKASLIAGSTRWVWALRHQTEAQYSAVESTRANVAVRNVVAEDSHQKPANCL